MNRSTLLQSGNSVRACLLSVYSQSGNDAGQQMARQFIYELGKVISDIQGAKNAASILYNVGDSITLDIPIEEFHLPPEVEEPKKDGTQFRRPHADILPSKGNIFIWGMFIGAVVHAILRGLLG